MTSPYKSDTYDDPFLLRLQKGICDVLATITTANGYKHDLTGAVFRGRFTYGDDDPLPMVCLIEPPQQENQINPARGATAGAGPYVVMVQGFVDDDKANPTDPAHRLLADVKCALALEIEKIRGSKTAFGIRANRLSDVSMDRGIVRPSDDISSKAYFWLPLRMTVAEKWTDPFGD
jgi:hypothetical protein